MVTLSDKQKAQLNYEASILQTAREIMARHEHGSHASCSDRCIMNAEQRAVHRAEVNAEIDAWIAQRDANPPTAPQEEVPF